jgi:hypothetical protein
VGRVKLNNWIFFGLVILWSGVMILSCLPMTLSSIYKEMVLGGDLDPIYRNGWVAIFKFFFTLLLVVPAGLAWASLS